jgi:hypothetical protein
VAIEILDGCVSGPGVGIGPVAPELVSCGRALLRTNPDARTWRPCDYDLATTAEVCLQGPGTEADSALLSRWLAD